MLRSDRTALSVALSQLDKVRRILPCACCAERLYRHYYSPSDSRYEPVFRLALDDAWSIARGSLSAAELRPVPESSVPDEDELEGFPYAQDAAIAVVELCNGINTNSVNNFIECLEQGYNVVDNKVLNLLVRAGSISEEHEAEIIEHPIVQAELVRQSMDIRACAERSIANFPELVDMLRERSVLTDLLS